MNDERLQDVEDTYQLLRKGLGHERVNDDNVDALIRRAEQDGQRILAIELREWQVTCSSGRGEVPSTIAPTRGFNREHVKH